jgi:hypothetical protein
MIPASPDMSALYGTFVEKRPGVLSQAIANEPDLPWGQGRFPPAPENDEPAARGVPGRASKQARMSVHDARQAERDRHPRVLMRGLVQSQGFGVAGPTARRTG